MRDVSKGLPAYLFWVGLGVGFSLLLCWFGVFVCLLVFFFFFFSLGIHMNLSLSEGSETRLRVGFSHDSPDGPLPGSRRRQPSTA